MRKVKKWSAALGAVLILFAGFQPIVAGPKPWDEHPWNGCVTSSTAVTPQRNYTYYQIQFSPTGGFYLIRVSFSAAQTPATDVLKTVKPKQ